MYHVCLLYSPSLSVFIVSDSEDTGAISSDDEENLPPVVHFASPAGPPKPPPASPYQTPCTPASGIMFWGSPAMENIKAQTTVSKKHRRPLGISNFYYNSPSGEIIYANIINVAADRVLNHQCSYALENITVKESVYGMSLYHCMLNFWCSLIDEYT